MMVIPFQFVSWAADDLIPFSFLIEMLWIIVILKLHFFFCDGKQMKALN